MSQKVQIYQNNNGKSTSFEKYFVRAVYDDDFVSTNAIADFIQAQASVKRSDCKAVLDELGYAFAHFLALGQKIKLEGIGIFKVGCSSKGVADRKNASAALVTKKRVIFSPETESVLKGTVTRADGTVRQTYRHDVVMLKDVTFELAQDSVGKVITNSAASGD